MLKLSRKAAKYPKLRDKAKKKEGEVEIKSQYIN